MDYPVLVRPKHHQLRHAAVSVIHTAHFANPTDDQWHSLQTDGMTEDGAFNMYLGITCCYIVGTAACWYIMHHFGRRSIYIARVALLVVWHVTIGSLGTVNSTKATLAIGAVMVIINFSTNATLFPATYTIAAEVQATRVKAKTIVLGRGVYLISSVLRLRVELGCQVQLLLDGVLSHIIGVPMVPASWDQK